MLLNHLDVWKRLFLNEILKTDCADMLQIIEILLITPFTNAKLEQMFSRMNRVETDFCNSLCIECLDNCLRICEEGCAINEFNPDKYPNKCQRIEGSRDLIRF